MRNAAHAATIPCLTQTDYANVVSLIPSTSQDLRWSWNSAAPTTLRAAGCADISANLWSLPTANGAVTMALTPSLQTTVAMTQITSPSGIVGFPELIYGYKPFGPVTTAQSLGMVFPIAVNKLPNLWLMTDYSVTMPDAGLPVNVDYDLWITQAYKGTGVVSGDIELMIWLYHNNVAPSGKLQPLETFTTPMWIQGTLQNGVFDIYLADPRLPNRTSELVTFVLRGTAGSGPLNGGYTSGYLGFNLQPFLFRAERALSNAYGWSTTTMNGEYVNGIEFGSEFTADNQQASYSTTLQQMCLIKPKTGTRPTQSNASAFVCP